MWQFICDSVYDLFHLSGNGYMGLSDWWGSRVFEWDRLLYGHKEAFNRQHRKK